MDRQPSPNFAYLAHHDARLVALATQAEEHFGGDPTVTLFKLRQFAEALTRRAAAKVGLFLGPQDTLQDLIERFRAASGMELKELVRFLKSEPRSAADYFAKHPALAPYLGRVTGAGAYKIVVSEAADQVREEVWKDAG